METVVTTSSPSSLRCSSKNEAANLNASIQQQQHQEQESNSYHNCEEETATKKKKKKHLEKQTVPFGEFSAVSHRAQSHFLPSSPPIGCSPTVQVVQMQWCERGIRSLYVLSRCQTQQCEWGEDQFRYCLGVRRNTVTGKTDLSAIVHVSDVNKWEPGMRYFYYLSKCQTYQCEGRMRYVHLLFKWQTLWCEWGVRIFYILSWCQTLQCERGMGQLHIVFRCQKLQCEKWLQKTLAVLVSVRSSSVNSNSQ